MRLVFQLALLGDGKSGPMGLRQIAGYLNPRGEIRICGSPDRLLKSLGMPIVGSVTAEVRSFEQKWLPG